VPRSICLGAAVAIIYFAGIAWQDIHSGLGLVLPFTGILVAGAFMLESLDELDSSSRAFQTF